MLPRKGWESAVISVRGEEYSSEEEGGKNPTKERGKGPIIPRASWERTMEGAFAEFSQ